MKLYAALSAIAVAPLLSDAQRDLAGAVWHPDHRLHLTVRHFGVCTKAQQQALQTALAAVCGPQLSLQLQGTAVFGGAHNPVAVTRTAPDEKLDGLAVQCDAIAAAEGLSERDYKFRPHVTLGAIDRCDARDVDFWQKRHRCLSVMGWEVDRFGLYRAHPGQRAERLAVYGLR